MLRESLPECSRQTEPSQHKKKKKTALYIYDHSLDGREQVELVNQHLKTTYTLLSDVKTAHIVGSIPHLLTEHLFR